MHSIKISVYLFVKILRFIYGEFHQLLNNHGRLSIIIIFFVGVYTQVQHGSNYTQTNNSIRSQPEAQQIYFVDPEIRVIPIKLFFTDSKSNWNVAIYNKGLTKIQAEIREN